jgi:membrane protease YdiL (CAAX protease family)
MTAKLLLWVLPTVAYVKRTRRAAIAEYFSLTDPGRGIGYGLLIGLGVLAVSFLLDFLLGGAGFSLPVLDLTLFSTVVVSPFAEEWALRGFYMREQMERGATLPSAGKNAAFVFVLMHLPGWYFQGRMREPLGLLQPAFFLWWLGFILAWSKNAGQNNKSGSLYAPMIVHALNNLYVAARG